MREVLEIFPPWLVNIFFTGFFLDIIILKLPEEVRTFAGGWVEGCAESNARLTDEPLQRAATATNAVAARPRPVIALCRTSIALGCPFVAHSTGVRRCAVASRKGKYR